jgi:hypothetical protein
MKEEEEKLVEGIKNFDWKSLATWTTVISITMIAFYGLGAIKHWKEIKKLK